jgi:hypothetical protein
MTLVVIFMILKKSLFVSSVLKTVKVTTAANVQLPYVWINNMNLRVQNTVNMVIYWQYERLTIFYSPKNNLVETLTIFHFAND